MKHCNYCDQDFSETEFRKNRRKCRACERKDGRAYAKKHSKKRKAYWKANVTRMHALQADWYQRNKERVHKKLKKRYHEDPEYRERKSINAAIRRWSGGRTNCPRDSKYLRCSYVFYTKWLQFNFSDGMTMESGDWHPDHVLPRNLFKLYDGETLNENNVRLCYSWYNVSPLSISSNLTKHDRIDLEQLERHVESLKRFAASMGVVVDPDYYELCATYLDAGNP